jgi:hypothetical protein
MKLWSLALQKCKGGSDANPRLAVFNAYPYKIEEPEGSVGELYFCHGAQLHGTSPKGATTTTWTCTRHTKSIEERGSRVNSSTSGDVFDVILGYLSL